MIIFPTIMADPLTLLRQFNISKKAIVEREDQIIFETISFLKTAKTNYVIGRTTPREYYAVEALLFLLKNVHLSHPIYVQRAGASNVPVVRFPDRKDLLAYLNGEKDHSANVDKSAPLELPLSRSATIGIKRSADDTSAEGSKKAKSEDAQNKQDIQEWLQLKLNKKEGAIITENIKGVKSGLNEVMSIDRIAEIKRKIMTRKRVTIKGDDDYNPEVPQVAPEQSTAMSFVVDTDNDMTKDILSRERQLRTRTSVLQSNGKDKLATYVDNLLLLVKKKNLKTIPENLKTTQYRKHSPVYCPQFLKNVLAILSSIKAQEEGKAAPQQQAPAVPTAKEVVNRKPATDNRYDRFNQESQSRNIQKDTEGFNIDTMATFHGLDLQSVKEGKSQRRSVPNPSPHNTLKPSSGSKSPGKPQKRESKTPIIIVPSGTTALISLLNCKDILQDYKFVSVEEKKRLGTIKENEVLVQRKKEVLINNQTQTVTVPFRIVDQPLKLQPNEWNRVAAVFVQGPTWQFKGWPYLLPDGSPTDIFEKVRAFYVRYDDMKTDVNVQKWNVIILTFNRNRRHMDRATVLKFWETLEKFLAKNKPNLRF